MAITNYTELQTALTNWLNRSDLTARHPEFIALAEARFKRDFRLRKIQTRTFSVSADDTSLPTDLKSIIALYHDGPTYYGPVEIVDPSTLATNKALYGTTGPPTYASPMAGILRTAPVADATYSLKMTYDAQVASLSTGSPTNWLLTDAPDIYLFGSLVESAPYLRDDARMGVWEGKLATAIEQFYDAALREEYSGTMVRKPRRPIG